MRRMNYFQTANFIIRQNLSLFFCALFFSKAVSDLNTGVKLQLKADSPYPYDDSSGNVGRGQAYGGVQNRCPNGSPKVGGSCLYFDGTGYVSWGATPSVLKIQNEITISAWIWPEAYNGGGNPSDIGFIAGTQNDMTSGGVTIFTDTRQNPDGQTAPAGHLHFQIGDGTFHTCNVQTVVPLNQWTMVTATRKGGEIAEVYYNGVKQNIQCLPWTSGSILYTDTIFSLGSQIKYWGSNTPCRYYKGYMEEIIIWNRKLSSSEISKLYENCKRTVYCLTQYSWKTLSWSSCSKTCGSGYRTRSVYCNEYLWDNVVSDSYCSGSKPSDYQTCNLGPCPTYSWKTGSWSSCSAECGNGQQSRSVYCVEDGSQQTVINSYCSSGTKPAGVQSCNLGECPTYSWLTGNWSSCSAECGNGQQNRSIYCVEIGSQQSVTDSFCVPETKPMNNQSCNVGECPTHLWLTGNWSSCSVECGNGEQSRSVYCVENGSHLTVNDSFCDPGTKPLNNQSCSVVVCPTHNWNTLFWSSCSAECGSGEQYRYVFCTETESENVVSDSYCNSETKPSSVQSCFLGECSTYSWYTGSWEPCSSECEGNGKQTRSVFCINDTKQCPDTYCSKLLKPISIQTCIDESCSSSGSLTEKLSDNYIVLGGSFFVAFIMIAGICVAISRRSNKKKEEIELGEKRIRRVSQVEGKGEEKEGEGEGNQEFTYSNNHIRNQNPVEEGEGYIFNNNNVIVKSSQSQFNQISQTERNGEGEGTYIQWSAVA